MSTSFLKKYKVLQKIGEGSFSEVLKCQDKETGTLYAAKRLKKIYQNMSEILESPEVIAMRKISRHPNILYMVESHYDPLPGKVTLIFELMDMSLYDLMKARKGRVLTEKRVKIYLYQLLKGLEHLHKHGIFHRDIKPENILLKGDVVKLADLGSIRGIYSRPPYTEYISTRWYRSPECLLTTGFYGPKMDVWATGCVFYELLTLKPLFPGSNEVDQITKIHSILGTPHARLVAKFRRHSKSRNCEYFFPTKGGSGVANLLPQVTDSGREILKLMLVYDPENRSNVKRLLEHRYFNDLRENESPRHSNTVTPCASSHEGPNNHQWRNPVLLSYITSERRRKCKPLQVAAIRRPKLVQLQVAGADGKTSSSEFTSGVKIPRIVASSPNYTGSIPARNFYNNKQNATKVSKSDKSNFRSVQLQDKTKALTRAWGTPDIRNRNRENVIKIGERVSKESAMDTSDDIPGCKLPNIEQNSKMIISRESSISPDIEFRSIPTQRGPSTLGTQYNHFNDAKTSENSSYEQKLHLEHRGRNFYEKDDPMTGFLPMIISPKPEILVHRGSGGAPIRLNGVAQISADSKIFISGITNRRNKAIRLATITERVTPSDLQMTKNQKSAPFKIGINKTPHCITNNNNIAVKSPAKKIAKHETSASASASASLSPTPSTVIPLKKIKPSPTKKLYNEKRERFGKL